MGCVHAHARVWHAYMANRAPTHACSLTLTRWAPLTITLTRWAPLTLTLTRWAPLTLTLTRWAPLLEPHGRLFPQTITDLHAMRGLAADDPAVTRPRRPNPFPNPEPFLTPIPTLALTLSLTRYLSLTRCSTST